MKPIKFNFSPAKGYAAIHWMVDEVPGIDLHTLLKACYFADRKHLNEYGRPVFGATYRAMRFGPVPLEIYEMAKGEPLWLAELKVDWYPWRLDGFRLHPTGNQPPSLDVLSESDLEALQDALRKSRTLTFDARTLATHGPDWQAAKLGLMRYEDMLDDSVDKAERVAYLREAAPHIRL